MKVIDLTTMPDGKRYEDTYGKYLDVFGEVALTPPQVEVLVVRPPASWVPLLVYLGASVRGWQLVFEHDQYVEQVFAPQVDNRAHDVVHQMFDRTMVEVLCGFRPECVDALWKCDMEWPTKRVQDERRKEFIVTTNGAYYRKEVLAYIDLLAAYRPTKRKAVLIPCAADKPYPAKLHQAVLDILPDDYELITATGVLGLVPQALWPHMPYYDSGIPNEWRLFNFCRDYFNRNDYLHVISYTDYYSYAIAHAFASLQMSDRVNFIDPPVRRNGYLDLLSADRLERLKALFRPGDIPPCYARVKPSGIVRCVCGNVWRNGEPKPACKHHSLPRDVV